MELIISHRFRLPRCRVVRFFMELLYFTVSDYRGAVGGGPAGRIVYRRRGGTAGQPRHQEVQRGQ